MLTERQRANLYNLWLMNPEMTVPETKSHYRFLGIDKGDISLEDLKKEYWNFIKLGSRKNSRDETSIGSNPFMEDPNDYY